MSQFIETHFDEKSGFVPCLTSWGKWWQTVSEVYIEVNVPSGTKSKNVAVTLKPTAIKVVVFDKTLIEGALFAVIQVNESTWTLEDQKLIHIVLSKSNIIQNEGLWLSLLDSDYVADSLTLHEMRKKLDLERYQMENPGFDFSGANLQKSYEDAAISPINDSSH